MDRCVARVSSGHRRLRLDVLSVLQDVADLPDSPGSVTVLSRVSLPRCLSHPVQRSSSLPNSAGFPSCVARALLPRFKPASLCQPTTTDLPCFPERDRFYARSPPFVGGALQILPMVVLTFLGFYHTDWYFFN